MDKDWDLLKVLPEENQRVIIFDIESSGINHNYGQILELSAVEMENEQFTGNQFQIFIKPRSKINKDASIITGLTNSFFKEYYEGVYHDEKEQLKLFLEFIGEESLLIGHNITFDFYFLNDELRRLNLPEIARNRFRCTLRLAKDLLAFELQSYKIQSYKLAKLCQFFKIYDEDGAFHSGLYDSFITGMLLKKLRKLSKHEITLDDLNLDLLTEKKTKPIKTKAITDDNTAPKPKKTSKKSSSSLSTDYSSTYQSKYNSYTNDYYSLPKNKYIKRKKWY